MKRLCHSIVLLLAATAAASAQTVAIYTSNVSLALGPNLNPPIYLNEGDQLRHENHAIMAGTNVLDLSESFVTYEVVSPLAIQWTNLLEVAVQTSGVGRTRVIVTPTNLPAGTYHAFFRQWNRSDNELTRTLSWDRLIVTNAEPCCGGGGGGSVTINDPTIYTWDGGTGTPDSVALYGGGLLATGVLDGAHLRLYLTGGGSSSITAVNEGGTNVGTFSYLRYIGSLQGTLTNDTLTLSVDALLPDFAVGTNLASWTCSGGRQFWSPPVGYTNMIEFKVTGAAGCCATTAGGGGKTTLIFQHIPGRLYAWDIGCGEAGVTGAPTGTYSARGWPDGGRGASRNANLAAPGGPGTFFYVIDGAVTTEVASAGGGGGTMSTGASGGGGGGESGGDGSYTGTGASSTNHGIAEATVGVILLTNSAGASDYAGDGGLSTNTTGAAGGGGGGHYKGGGGFASSTTARTGGGGVGHVDTSVSGLVYAETERAIGGLPPDYYDPEHPAGAGVAGNPGGHGAVTARY